MGMLTCKAGLIRQTDGAEIRPSVNWKHSTDFLTEACHWEGNKQQQNIQSAPKYKEAGVTGAGGSTTARRANTDKQPPCGNAFVLFRKSLFVSLRHKIYLRKFNVAAKLQNFITAHTRCGITPHRGHSCVGGQRSTTQ